MDEADVQWGIENGLSTGTVSDLSVGMEFALGDRAKESMLHPNHHYP